MKTLKPIAVILLVLSVHGGANAYIAVRLYYGVSRLFPWLPLWVYTVVYVCIAFSVIPGFAPHSYGMKKMINTFCTHWLGVHFYLLAYFLLGDGVLFVLRMMGVALGETAADARLGSVWVAVGLTGITVLYGKRRAKRVKTVSYEIRTNHPALSEGMTIAMAADLHLGASGSERNLFSIIKGINDMDPDAVCLVGDIFNDDFNLLRDPALAAMQLKSIKSKFGVYACLGNHDGGLTFDEMQRFLALSGVQLLNDAHATLGRKITLVGRLDANPIFGYGGMKRAELSSVMAGADTRFPVVVMDHNPSYSGEYGDDFILVLCGHTHRGQILPVNSLTRAMHSAFYGHYEPKGNGPHVVVTSGVGTWGPPMRIGTDNEIVRIYLR
jgi:hypothetical protein